MTPPTSSLASNRHPCPTLAQPLRRTRLALASFTAFTALAGLLSACGGGGSESGDDRTELQTGDSISYQSVNMPLGASSSTTSVYTATIKTVEGEAQTQAVTYQNGSATHTQVFSQADKLSSDSYGTVSCTRNPEGLIFPSGSLSLDQTWTYSYGETCSSGGVMTLSSTATGSGKIVSFETKTVAGVAFDAVKYQVGEQVLRTDGIAISRQQTCWRDTTMLRVLVCSEDATQTSTAPGTSPSLSHTDLTLLGFSVARNAVKLPTVVRFAGVWEAAYTGADVGTCNLSVASNGAATGTCYSDVNGAFSVSGSVTVSGAFTLAGGNGASFSGSLSPLTGSGSWMLTGTSGGRWTASHK